MQSGTPWHTRIFDKMDIPLLLSRSPHFACTCLFHCLIYALSFVFRASWLHIFCLCDSLAIPPISKSVLCSLDLIPMTDSYINFFCLLLRQYFPINCSQSLSNPNQTFLLFPPLPAFTTVGYFPVANVITTIPVYNALTAQFPTSSSIATRP